MHRQTLELVIAERDATIAEARDRIRRHKQNRAEIERLMQQLTRLWDEEIGADQRLLENMGEDAEPLAARLARAAT